MIGRVQHPHISWIDDELTMFIHFGMSTFVRKELPDGTDPSTTYAPETLDVDQWIQVAGSERCIPRKSPQRLTHRVWVGP